MSIKATAILAGLNKVNPECYNGWDGKAGCEGCEQDVDNMTRIFRSKGFTTKIFKTKKATKTNILEELNYAAKTHGPNDIVSFYYSGHGSQIGDFNGDEIDGKDETFCAYDGVIADDEIGEIWTSFAPGTRILMISDSCRSGTNYRNSPFIGGNHSQAEPQSRAKTKSQTRTKAWSIDAQIIHLSACRDEEDAMGQIKGGIFTNALCKVWNGGQFQGDYKKFHKEIAAEIRFGQAPQFNADGKITDWFLKQGPFSVALARSRSPATA